MTDTMTSQNIDLSSWDTLYMIYIIYIRYQITLFHLFAFMRWAETTFMLLSVRLMCYRYYEYLYYYGECTLL